MANIVLEKNYKELIKNNKLILRTQQRFISEMHSVYTNKVNKIVWSSKNVKIMQSTDSIQTYAYGINKDLARKKKEIKCNNIIKQYTNV